VGDVTITVSWIDRIMDLFDAGNGGDFGWLSDGPGTDIGDDFGGTEVGEPHTIQTYQIRIHLVQLSSTVW
jgi:hypothetical protein